MIVTAMWFVVALTNGQAQPGPPALEVQQADAAFWAAYNVCNAGEMADAFTEDAEFYHDVTGLTRTRSAIVDSLMRGPCGGGGLSLRREAIPNTVRAWPLAGPYMFVTGEHVFYVQRPGQPEQASARARFADVWRRDPDRWRMVRVISYDHGSPPYTPPQIDRSFDPARLPDYAGRYHSAEFGDVVIVVEGGGLRMRSGDLSLLLLPISRTRFAASERDLQFEFGADALTVFQGGAAVTTAPRVS